MDLKTFRALASAAPTAPEEPMGMQVQSVTELNEYLRALFAGDAHLSSVLVRGEISNFVAHRSGHYYFSLKDEGGVIRAVMFRAEASQLPFQLENGMKVLVQGRVSVYVPSGQYQIVVSVLMPDGIGALHLAYEQRRRKLEAEGLFDPARKRPLPYAPQRVGVITSPTGAAVRDIIHILGRRFPLATVVLYPALVQGEEAPAQLMRGLAYFNTHATVDVIILGRGGGSMEDLFAFNDEQLVRAVAASAIPVISAVGHETDVTLCDLAADRRAPTPSAAAELAVPDAVAVRAQIAQWAVRLQQRLPERVAHMRHALDALSSRPCLSRPQHLLEDRAQRLDLASMRLSRAMQTHLHQATAIWEKAGARLQALSPLAVLQRGYCAAFTQEGEVVTRAADAQIGMCLSLRFADGTVEAQAITIEQSDPAAPERGKENEKE